MKTSLGLTVALAMGALSACGSGGGAGTSSSGSTSTSGSSGGSGSTSGGSNPAAASFSGSLAFPVSDVLLVCLQNGNACQANSLSVTFSNSPPCSGQAEPSETKSLELNLLDSGGTLGPGTYQPSSNASTTVTKVFSARYTNSGAPSPTFTSGTVTLTTISTTPKAAIGNFDLLFSLSGNAEHIIGTFDTTAPSCYQ